MSQIISAASSVSDIVSLNTNLSEDDERWQRSNCVSPRDFKDLMQPEHYTIVSHLANGFGAFRREGLCGGEPNQDEDEDEEDEGDCEDRGDIVEDASIKTEERDRNEETAKVANEQGKGEDEADKMEKPAKKDIYMDKVLQTLAREEDDPNDWRNWISPPCSPCSANTVAAAE